MKKMTLTTNNNEQLGKAKLQHYTAMVILLVYLLSKPSETMAQKGGIFVNTDQLMVEKTTNEAEYDAKMTIYTQMVKEKDGKCNSLPAQQKEACITGENNRISQLEAELRRIETKIQEIEDTLSLGGKGFGAHERIRRGDPENSDLVPGNVVSGSMDCLPNDLLQCNNMMASDFNSLYKIKNTDGSAKKYCISRDNVCKQKGSWSGAPYEMIGSNTYHSLYKSGWVYASCDKKFADYSLLAENRLYHICQVHVKLSGSCIIKADVRNGVLRLESKENRTIGYHISNSGDSDMKGTIMPYRKKSITVDLISTEDHLIVRCGGQTDTISKYKTKEKKCEQKFENIMSVNICRYWIPFLIASLILTSFIIVRLIERFLPSMYGVIMFSISLFTYPITYLFWAIWPRLYLCSKCGDIDFVLYHRHDINCICNESPTEKSDQHNKRCLVTNLEARSSLNKLDKFKVITRSRLSSFTGRYFMRSAIVLISLAFIPKSIAYTGLLDGETIVKADFNITYEENKCLTICEYSNNAWSAMGETCKCEIKKEHDNGCHYSIIETIGSMKKVYVTDIDCSEKIDLCGTNAENFRYLKVKTCQTLKENVIYRSQQADYVPLQNARGNGSCVKDCLISTECSTAFYRETFCENPCVCKFEKYSCGVMITEKYNGQEMVYKMPMDCSLDSFRDTCTETYEVSQLSAVANYYETGNCSISPPISGIYNTTVILDASKTSEVDRREAEGLLAWKAMPNNRKMLSAEIHPLRTSKLPGPLAISPSSPQLSIISRTENMDAIDYKKTPLYNSKDFSILYPNMSFPYKHQLSFETYFSKFDSSDSSRFEITADLMENYKAGFELVGKSRMKIPLIVYVPSVSVTYKTNYLYTTCKTKEIKVVSNDLCVGNCGGCKRQLGAPKNAAVMCREDAQRFGCEAEACLNTGGALCAYCFNVKDLNDCLEVREVESFDLTAVVCLSFGRNIKCALLKEGSTVHDDNFESYITFSGRKNTFKVGDRMAIDKYKSIVYQGDIAPKGTDDTKFGHPQWADNGDSFEHVGGNAEWTYNCKWMGDKEVKVSQCYHDTYKKKSGLKKVNARFIEYVEGPVEIHETNIQGSIKMSFDLPKVAAKEIVETGVVHVKSSNCKGCHNCDMGFHCVLDIMSDEEGAVAVSCESANVKNNVILLHQQENNIEIYGHSDKSEKTKCNLMAGRVIIDSFDLNLETLETDEEHSDPQEYQVVYKQKWHQSLISKLDSLNPVGYIMHKIRNSRLVKIVKAIFWLALLALFFVFIMYFKRYFQLIRNSYQSIKPIHRKKSETSEKTEKLRDILYKIN